LRVVAALAAIGDDAGEVGAGMRRDLRVRRVERVRSSYGLPLGYANTMVCAVASTMTLAADLATPVDVAACKLARINIPPSGPRRREVTLRGLRHTANGR
jgi:hypothetical protein